METLIEDRGMESGGRKGEDGGEEFEKERWKRLTLGESIAFLSLHTPRPPSFAGFPLVLLPKNAGTRQHPESSVTLESELQLNFQPI